MDPTDAPPRLGWARILAIAVSDCVVGFAVFFAAYVGLQGAGELEPEASAVLQTPQWSGLLLACSLIVPPAAVAAFLWVGTRRLYVWLASGLYLVLAVALGVGVGWHLAAGVLPTFIAAGLYTLPRKRPKASVASGAAVPG